MNNKYTYNEIVIISVVVAIVLLILFGVSVYHSFNIDDDIVDIDGDKMPEYSYIEKDTAQNKQYIQPYIDIGFKATTERDFDAAIESLEKVAVESIEQQDRNIARILIARNYFDKGGELNEQLSVRMLKSIIADPSVGSYLKSWAVDALLALYYKDASLRIFEEIFTGEPYESFAKEGNQSLALKRLAEFSYEFHPNSLAVLSVALWYSSELLNNKELLDDKRIEYTSKVEKLLKKSDNLFFSENPLWVRSKAGHFHWQGFHTGVLAIDNPSLVEEFEGLFQKSIDLYLRDQSGVNSHIAQFAPYSHFYRAALLYEIFGKERRDDIQTDLLSVVSIVNKDPRPAQNEFLSFVKRERDREIEKRDHNYYFFVDLASLSPQFTDFLVSHGWKL